MYKNLKIALIGAMALVVGMIVKTNAQVNTEVTLGVLGGNVTIGVTVTGFNFGDFQVQSTDVITGRQFTGTEYFYVDDVKGANSGWYTTLQVTDLTGTQIGNTISGSNVSLKVDTTVTTKISGTPNANVVVDSTLLAYTPLNSAVTFIKRDAAANGGKLGRYAAFPWLQVTIPAYQSVDTYQGTITYTIFEN